MIRNRNNVTIDQRRNTIPCNVSTQAGDTSGEKVGLWPEPFVPEQYVRKRVEVGNQNVPAYKAIVPSELLACVWLNVLRGFHENCADVCCAHLLAHLLDLHMHGINKVSKKGVGGEDHTYLMVCIAERHGLLMDNLWIKQVIVFSVGRVRFCGPIFLALRGSLAKAMRWIGKCSITQFALEGHDIVRVDQFCRWAGSTSRSTRSRSGFDNKRVKCCRRRLALDRRA